MNEKSKSHTHDVLEILKKGKYSESKEIFNSLPAYEISLIIESSPPKRRALIWQLIEEKNEGEIQRRYGKNGYYFNFKKYKTVYIGNTAHYAAYALEDGLTVAYIQSIKEKIDELVRENPALASIKAGVVPKPRVAGAIPETKKGTPMLERPTSVLRKNS